MKINQKAFKTWLSKHPRLVFRKRDTCKCPIARYLTAKGVEQATVGIDTYYLDRNPLGRGRLLPEWAVAFIGRIDRGDPASVSGRRALEILKEVELT